MTSFLFRVEYYKFLLKHHVCYITQSLVCVYFFILFKNSLQSICDFLWDSLDIWCLISNTVDSVDDIGIFVHG